MAITITDNTNCIQIDNGSERTIFTKKDARVELIGDYVSLIDWDGFRNEFLWSDVTGATSPEDLADTLNEYLNTGGGDGGGATGPQGPAGATGAQGPAGPDGIGAKASTFRYSGTIATPIKLSTMLVDLNTPINRAIIQTSSSPIEIDIDVRPTEANAGDAELRIIFKNAVTVSFSSSIGTLSDIFEQWFGALTLSAGQSVLLVYDMVDNKWRYVF